MALVSLMVLYEDDSVEVQFTDGSSLQLSPCGSEFLFEKAPAPSLHPLQSSCRVRQRTQFVISSYKEQLLHALEFRNRFASRPYLPADLIAVDKLSNLFHDISKVKWPGADGEGAATMADNGRVTVSSPGGHAFLYLSPSQLEFTVKFMARVSQPVSGKPLLKPGPSWSGGPHQQPRPSREKVKPVGFGAARSGLGRSAGRRQNEVQGVADPPVSELRGGGSTEICSKYMHQYAWAVQHHTVSSCPPEWHRPLRLALHCNRQQEKTPGPDGTDILPQSGGEPGTDTALPRPMPLNCPAPHLHRCQTEYAKRDEAVKGDEKTRKKFHSFVLFLGELYLNLEIKGPNGAVTRAEILQTGLCELLSALFSQPMDDNLTCAVKLLKLTGSILEDAWKTQGKSDMKDIIQRIENVVLDSDCSRDVKQMLLKLVELRSSNWGRVHTAATYNEATPENDPNYYMNEPVFYSAEGIPLTPADPDYLEKYQEMIDREELFQGYSDEDGDAYLDDSEDEMDPEMEEAFEKFCAETEKKRK